MIWRTSSRSTIRFSEWPARATPFQLRHSGCLRSGFNLFSHVALSIYVCLCIYCLKKIGREASLVRLQEIIVPQFATCTCEADEGIILNAWHSCRMVNSGPSAELLKGKVQNAFVSFSKIPTVSLSKTPSDEFRFQVRKLFLQFFWHCSLTQCYCEQKNVHAALFCLWLDAKSTFESVFFCLSPPRCFPRFGQFKPKLRCRVMSEGGATHKAHAADCARNDSVRLQASLPLNGPSWSGSLVAACNPGHLMCQESEKSKACQPKQLTH